MRKKMMSGVVCLVAALLVGTPAFSADDDDKEPKYKTKEIMKEAFKGGLIKKVAGGGASEEDVKKVHEMMVALSKNEPKRGDEESWKKFTAALVKASKAVAEGDKDAGAALNKAANCKACHSSHK